ncbi:hypothetical protein MTR_3g467720 [Medicago truncatula]|uniref:Uncharacterized protein n=1 Tax=Medicago truncatula TaxID=3880 RepID=A0A072UYW7_MEDTR|nr:hypothetical protein MTR_3g467720 [Medicago truncatula]
MGILGIMVENAKDVPRETKPNFVEFFGDVKPPKVEAKPNINGASKYVDSGVLPLQAHEVDTASKQTKEWGLNILNGVHNHAMMPALEGHILGGRLKEDDKKIVRDLTKSKMLPRHILIHLKNKRPHCMTNVKQMYNERQL